MVQHPGPAWLLPSHPPRKILEGIDQGLQISGFQVTRQCYRKMSRENVNPQKCQPQNGNPKMSTHKSKSVDPPWCSDIYILDLHKYVPLVKHRYRNVNCYRDGLKLSILWVDIMGLTFLRGVIFFIFLYFTQYFHIFLCISTLFYEFS